MSNFLATLVAVAITANMTKTKGAALLARYLKRSQRSQSDLARELGRVPVTVHQWCAGKARPNTVARELLANVAGIPAEAWLTEKERAQLAA